MPMKMTMAVRSLMLVWLTCLVAAQGLQGSVDEEDSSLWILAVITCVLLVIGVLLMCFQSQLKTACRKRRKASSPRPAPNNNVVRILITGPDNEECQLLSNADDVISLSDSSASEDAGQRKRDDVTATSKTSPTPNSAIPSSETAAPPTYSCDVLSTEPGPDLAEKANASDAATLSQSPESAHQLENSQTFSTPAPVPETSEKSDTPLPAQMSPEKVDTAVSLEESLEKSETPVSLQGIPGIIDTAVSLEKSRESSDTVVPLKEPSKKFETPAALEDLSEKSWTPVGDSEPSEAAATPPVATGCTGEVPAADTIADSTADSTADTAKDSSEQTAADITLDTTAGNATDTTADNIAETAADIAAVTIADSALYTTAIVDTAADIAADTAADITMDTAADITADTAADITMDTAADITADTAADITMDTAADIAADTAPDIIADTAKDITADTAADIIADTAKNITADTAADITMDTTHSTADITMDTTHSTADNTADIAPDIPPKQSGKNSKRGDLQATDLHHNVPTEEEKTAPQASDVHSVLQEMADNDSGLRKVPKPGDFYGVLP